MTEEEKDEEISLLIVHAKYLMQRLLQYREALYPFAEAYDMLEECDSINAADLYEHPLTRSLQVGDIRKAREVYGKLIPPIKGIEHD